MFLGMDSMPIKDQKSTLYYRDLEGYILHPNKGEEMGHVADQILLKLFYFKIHYGQLSGYLVKKKKNSKDISLQVIRLIGIKFCLEIYVS